MSGEKYKGSRQVLGFKNRKFKVVLTLILVLLMAGYFNVVGTWEVNIFWKNYLALIPLQILAIIYVFYYKITQ
jgi:hypothetical protein